MTNPESFVDAQIEQYVSQEDLAHAKSELISCPEINNNLCGHIYEISKNHAKSIFVGTADMIVDEQGLLLNAFVFAAANYVALAAVNKEYSVLISSKSYFYAPLKFGDVLFLEAQALFDENSRKREVKVSGFVKEIKVFEANMQVVVTDAHIFKMERPQNKKLSDSSETENEDKQDKESAKPAAMPTQADAMAMVADLMSKKN